MAIPTTPAALELLERHINDVMREIPYVPSLLRKSLKTIDEHMQDKTDMVESIELLVEIDRKVAQHGSRFGETVTNKARTIAETMSERLAKVGRETIHVGEEFIPYGLNVDNQGNIRFVFEVKQEDGEPEELYRYVRLTLDQLDDSFPDIASDVRNLVIAAELAPTKFFHETAQRLTSKPALVALVLDYLKNGRAVINGLKASKTNKIKLASTRKTRRTMGLFDAAYDGRA